MKFCPTCQRGYEDSQKFCPQDATPLAEGAPARADAGGAPHAHHQQHASHGSPGSPRKRMLWPFVVGGVAVLGLGVVLVLGLGAFFLSKSVRDGDTNQTAPVNSGAPGGYPPAPPFGSNVSAPASGMNANMGAPFDPNVGAPGMTGAPGGMNPGPNMSPGGSAGMPGPPAPPGPPGAPGAPGGQAGGDGEVNVDGPPGGDYGGEGEGMGDGGRGQTGGGGAVPPELNRIENEFIHANVRGDRAALENILADNFVGQMAGGPQVNKQQFLQNVSPSQSDTSFSIEDMRAMERGNAAMLTGVITFQTPQGPRRFRFADTYERQGGRWRIVSSQLAPG